MIVALLCATFTLIAIWLAAAPLKPAICVLVRLQVVYWSMGYVARPLYLLIELPDLPHPLADVRLMHTDYGEGLEGVLTLVLVGLVSYALTVIFLGRMKYFRNQKESDCPAAAASDVGSDFAPLIALFLIGWFGRLGYLSGATALLDAVGSFATTAVCVGILVLDTRTKYIVVVGVVALLSEAAWTVLFASKTPLLAMLCAVAIRWAQTLSSSEVRRRLPAVATVAVVVFLLVQPLKGVDTAADVKRYSDTEHPLATGAVVSLLQRTDLVSAAADAYFYPKTTWMGPEEYAETVLLAAIPKGPLAEYENQGIRWTREVRSASYPEQFLSVYLATGFVAEGYVEGGVLGVVVESGIFAIVTFLVGVGLQRRSLIILVLAGALAFDTTLYERGVIGLAETVPKAAEMVVVVYGLTVLSRRFVAPKRLEPNGMKSGLVQ